jgi:hypothetical protein
MISVKSPIIRGIIVSLLALVAVLNDRAFGAIVESDVPLLDFEREQVTIVFKDLLAKIPSDLLPQNKPLTFRFRRFMESKGVRKVKLIERCPSGIDRSALARAFGEGEIHLNYDLISVLALPESQAPLLKCGHHNLYRAALGAIVHALAIKLPQSKSSQFMNLMGFANTWFGFVEHKNAKRDRSADAAEFASRAESLATNLEFYLLDPEYPCRRPAVAHYFDREFNQSRVANRRCEAHTQVSTFSGLQRFEEKAKPRVFELDPARVYRIDYIFVDPGAGLGSGFGHSMFRLVVCAPGETVGENCLDQTENHLVISYMGSVSDPLIDVWKGLFGGYSMLLNVVDWATVVEFYGMAQMRKLVIYPMRLSAFEKSLFVYQVLENYWAYAGRYFFFSRNCATEVADHVLAVSSKCAITDCSSITPRGVTDDLIRSGVLDESQIQTVPSAETRFREVFEKLLKCANRVGQKSPIDREEFLDLDADSRMQIMAKALAACSNGNDLSLDDAIFLERLAMFKVEGRLAYRTAVALNTPADPIWERRADALTHRGLLQQMRSIHEKNVPWIDLNQVGYGVPMAADFKKTQVAMDSVESFKSKDQFMIDLGRDLFADLGREYELTQKNVIRLKQDLR